MTAYGKTAPLSENNFFELLDYVCDLPVAYVAAQIAQSTAWRIDTMLVAESRNLFKHIRSELFEQGGIESLAELTSALANAEFAEHSINTQQWWNKHLEKQTKLSPQAPWDYGSDEEIIEEWFNKRTPNPLPTKTPATLHSVHDHDNLSFLHYYLETKTNYPND